MLPYFALAGAGLAGGPLLRRRPEYRRRFLLALGLACWLTASLRYVTGFDYRSYEGVFQRIAAGGLSSLAGGLSEPGFVLLNLAAGFHRSALVILPLYFLLNLRPSPRRYAAAAAAAGAAYLFLDPLLRLLLAVLPVYRSYPGGTYWQGNSAVYLLAPLGCFLLTLPLIRQAVRAPSVSPVLANAAVCTLLVQLFITRHFILERLSIYTAIFSLLSLPEAVRASGERRAGLWTALVVLFGLAYLLFAASQGFHGAYPYHGVWSRAAP